MRVALVTRDNGVGLSTDLELLEDVLHPEKHSTVRVDWRAEKLPRCDVAIHLELLNHRLLGQALKGDIGIFNLEWFQARAWRGHLPRFRQLWAKSREAYNTLRQWGLGPRVHLTGFAGRDMHDPEVPRHLAAVHLAGHSSHKNTDAVIAAWRDNPDLPPLTIISHTPREVPPHVRLLPHLSDDALWTELNRATIHLCPSSAEGWGHYIAEALSVGAHVITVDGSPMNEHVRPEFGTLIRPLSVGRSHSAVTYRVAPGAVADAVRKAALLPDTTRERMGQAARQHLLARNAQFSQTALDLLRRL